MEFQALTLRWSSSMTVTLTLGTFFATVTACGTPTCPAPITTMRDGRGVALMVQIRICCRVYRTQQKNCRLPLPNKARKRAFPLF
jgi:hypothetical protein